MKTVLFFLGPRKASSNECIVHCTFVCTLYSSCCRGHIFILWGHFFGSHKETAHRMKYFKNVKMQIVAVGVRFRGRIGLG